MPTNQRAKGTFKLENTNPRYKNFVHSIFTAGDVNQFNSSRIRRSLTAKPVPDFTSNLFQPYKVVQVANKFKNLDAKAVGNTFRYLFYKFKKGIFVRIANSQLESFIPFSNAHFKNEFADRIAVDPKWKGNVQAFLDSLSQRLGYARTGPHIPINEWIANNGLLRFEFQKFESDNNVDVLYDMFLTLVKERELPDVEFFLNRRDFPQMKINATEPYNHIYDSENYPLISYNYKKYAPILSGSVAKQYADIAFPTYEDWTRVRYSPYPKIKQVAWRSKVNRVVFRGASTGIGYTPETNQRLKALQLSLFGSPFLRNLLDIGITNWNLRPRKYENVPYLQSIDPPFPNSPKMYPITPKMNLQEQSHFKFILTLEGHVAAYRLSYEMSSGSVILLAESNWKMWFYHFIKPYVHYVPVARDLSDLEEVIKWCLAHDEDCRLIAENALAFYQTYLGEKGILDFLQKELWEVSLAVGAYSYFPDLIVWTAEEERRLLNIEHSDVSYRFNLPAGPRCIGRLDGIATVFRAKTMKELTYEASLFRNTNGDINLYQMNNCLLVGKFANNEAKKLEHVHESYIGVKAINFIVGKIPNFMYVYGPIKDEKDTVFVEYINGPSMMNWLKSGDYSVKTLLDILLQVNMALAMAQNYTGFIHYDLYPWNIIIQTLPEKIKVNYFIDIDTVLSFETDTVPVLIDYGKSRCLVFEKEYGLVDHGFANLYRVNPIIDTLTLLYGTVNVLRDANKIAPSEALVFDVLLDFARIVGIKDFDNVKFYGRYGALFDYERWQKGNGPKQFIDHLVVNFPMQFSNSLLRLTPDNLEAGKFYYLTERGNPIYTAACMLYGDEQKAFLELINHIDQNRYPLSSDDLFQKVINNIVYRRLAFMYEEVESRGSATVRSKWDRVVKIFNYQPPITSYEPLVEYPKPRFLPLNEDVTPQDVAKSVLPYMPDEMNWAKIHLLWIESYLFGITRNVGDFGRFISMRGFDFQNALASEGTRRKLATLNF